MTKVNYHNLTYLEIKKKNQLTIIWQQYRKNTIAMIGLIIFLLLILIAISSQFILDYESDIILMNNQIRLQAPSAEHILGTDRYGRDILYRIIWGSRVSLTVGLFTVGIALVVGGTIGAIAGYYGGIIDNVLMRIMDVFLAMPATIMAVAIVGALGPGLINLLVAMSITRIAQFARVMRSSFIAIRGEEFIEAARAVGTKDIRIIIRHILPNCVGPIIVQCTLHMATTILGVAGLSFIGLGIQAPTPEWGSMLSEARDFMETNFNMMLYPGLAIVIAVLSLNLIGDGLRDALDPRLKK